MRRRLWIRQNMRRNIPGIYNRYEKARQRMAAIEELRLERNAKRTKVEEIIFSDLIYH